MKKLLLFGCVIFPSLVLSQEKENNWGIRFNGYVKTDIFFDSRQTESIREGHFLLYPKDDKLDVNGKDINAAPSFNILSIQSRLNGAISGPDALGAKTSAMIEGEFFGHSNGDINGFRLRHSFIKLNWTKTELLVGQYWHPMFVTSCFPDVVSFNTGAPFQPFSRNPQIRFTQKLGKINMVITALSQRDFVNNGPNGAGFDYLRNSVVPDMNVCIQYHTKNDTTDREFLVGVGGDYKKLTPGLTTDSVFKSIQKVEGYAGMFFMKYKLPKITFKIEGVYGQLLDNLTMLGGYVERKTINERHRKYIPINTYSIWTDIHTNGKKVQVGLFGGYTVNRGTNEEVKTYYSRGSNMASAYRVAPRLVYNIEKLRFAPELEYTVAAYGSPDSNGIVKKTESIANFRVLLGVYYFFN